MLQFIFYQEIFHNSQTIHLYYFNQYQKYLLNIIIHKSKNITRIVILMPYYYFKIWK